MKKATLLAGIMALVSALGLSAAPTPVTFWTTFTPPFSDYLQKMVDTYNAGHSGAAVTMVQVPGAETDVAKLMTAVRGGTGPDVYMLDRFTTAERAAAGVLTDLSPFIKKADPNLGIKYLPFAWNESQFRGKTWSLPFDTDTRALYYRKDLLKGAGVDVSVLDPKNGPITVDQLKAICAKFDKKDASGDYERLGFIPTFNQGWHYTWGFAFGGRFADFKAGKVTPTDPGVVAGFQFLYDWAKAYGPDKIRSFLSTYNPPNNPPEQDMFIAGKVAMVVTGDWFISSMAQYAPGADYGITYIPVPKKGAKPSTWAGGWSFTIPQGAKNAQAAFDFISWAAGPEGQKIYTVSSSHLPTIRSLSDDMSLFPGQHKFFRETLSFASSRPALPVGGLYWDALSAAQDEVMDNASAPKDALSKVIDKVQPQLDKFLPLQ
jgi:multiple sugar transport system substrate-binding protein